MSNEEQQQQFVGIREGAAATYLAKPRQARHSREGGNPVREPWPLPSKWRWARMGDVSDVIGGSTPKTDRSDYFGGEIPWITPADLSGYKEKTISRGARNITQAGLDNSGARLMPAGTVLFSSRAPIGYVAIATNAVATNQGFKSFVLGSELLPDYVYYWLQVAKKFAIEMASGTTFLEISGKKTADLPIPVAPLDEQRRIVAELETQLTRLDASVTALKRVQANLKRYRASVLKAACERGIAPSDGNWSFSTVRDVLQIIDYRGRTPPYAASGIPHLRSSNIKSGRIVWDGLAYVTEATYAEYMTRGLPEAGDVLFTTEAPMGEVALAPDSKFSLAQRMMILRPNQELLDSKFLMIQISSPQFQARLKHSGTGSTVTGVSSRNFQPLLLAIPPIAEQRRIIAEVERRLSVIEELEATVAANLKRAERLRQSVLARGFS